MKRTILLVAVMLVACSARRGVVMDPIDLWVTTLDAAETMAAIAGAPVPQDKPAPAAPPVQNPGGTPGQGAPAKDAPAIAPQDQQQAVLLRVVGDVWKSALALDQKELDAVNAEFGRLVERLQKAQPNYDVVLSPQGVLSYVKKVEKKDVP